MKLLLCGAWLALAGWLVVGCGDPVAENKAKVEAQWKAEAHALIAGDKPAFQSLLCFATKSQTSKVDLTFGIASGLAKGLKVTEADLRIDNIAFNKEFTQATVAASIKDAKEASGWKSLGDAEIWVRENGRWLRQL